MSTKTDQGCCSSLLGKFFVALVVVVLEVLLDEVKKRK